MRWISKVYFVMILYFVCLCASTPFFFLLLLRILYTAICFDVLHYLIYSRIGV